MERLNLTTNVASLTVRDPANDSPGSSVFDLPVQSTEKRETRAPVSSVNSLSVLRSYRVQDSKHLDDPSETTTITVDPGDSIPDETDSIHRARPGESKRKQEHVVSYVVISGGTGGNAICSAFAGHDTCYALPVSDDGGSSSEIIRTLGGPSVGDIRSRLVRLIPPASSSSPLDAIRRLLAYRLPANVSEREAREEWRDIVEGRSPLWEGIPNDRKETIRGFLVYFESEILKRAHKNFNFQNGSVGNFFLAAAQGFFRSLPSAIFLFSSITNSQANIAPVIVTNHTVTIAAELANGERLVGQCEISHPVQQPTFIADPPEPWSPVDGIGEVILPVQNVKFESSNKDEYVPLRSPIQRLFYINAYGIEIRPSPNPDFLHNLESKDVLVYSCGSLWTSIMPCLALRGVADAIARSRSLRAKILLLNSQNDRETEGYTAADYIHAIVQTLNTSYNAMRHGMGNANTTYPISAFITDLVYVKNTAVKVDEKHITSLGVRCTEAEPAGPIGSTAGQDVATPPKFDAESVKRAIDSIMEIRHDETLG
ncbi:UPF0052-domain-containing protein [Pluteus cervinus]|uniref:UPF0052-domain-containing protein n=1 Tax=Pluteus cervinus TaxID=181527 RepID=A0ACD3BFJ7_9AGAR|nr:UPF0052-domain-containing protein [Pluteus cervinus]